MSGGTEEDIFQESEDQQPAQAGGDSDSEVPSAAQTSRATDATSESKAEEGGLPRWAQEPIVTLLLKEYKNGSLLGQIPIGEKKRYIFGRDPTEVDVFLAHPTVSRKQACIIHGTPPGPLLITRDRFR